MKIEPEDRTMKNSSVNHDNEKFFKELATAYVNREGEELKKETLRTLDYPVGNLDKKMKQALRVGSKEDQLRKRRNRNIALSSMAAVFMMFIIYSAVIPTMNPREWPEVAPEAAVEEAADDMMFITAEPEAPAVMEYEEVAWDVDDDLEEGFFVGEAELPVDPTELRDFDGLFASAFIVEQFVATLPEGYRLTDQTFYQEGTQLHLYSATRLPILLTEASGELFGREVHGDTEIIDVNGVEVFQSRLADDEVQLSFQATDSYFTVIGSYVEELIAVARAIIDFPGLYLSNGTGDVDGTEEVEFIPLPRGLFMIVP